MMNEDTTMYRFSTSFLVALLLVITVQAGEITLQRTLTLPEIEFSDGFHHFVTSPGPLYGPAGSPELPQVGHRILLPPGEEIISTRIENDAWQSVPGSINLRPAQPPVPYCQSGEQPFVPPDANIYSTNNLYPAETVQMVRTDFSNGHGIGTVTITSSRYRPASGHLEHLTSYDLIVETATTARAMNAYNTMLKKTPRIIQRLSRNVENPEGLSAYGALDELDEATVK